MSGQSHTDRTPDGDRRPDARRPSTAELDARLDAAFGRLPDSDDLRDLKDELRASLAARVEELEASGSGPVAAVATAMAEVGDLDALAAEVEGEGAGVPARSADAGGRDGSGEGDVAPVIRHAELARRHHVRPKPWFVVRTVVLALVAAAALALTVLLVLGMPAWPLAASVTIAIALLAAPIGVIVGDGVHQETSAHYPMPAGRSAAYGASAFLGLGGLALAALYLGRVIEGDASQAGLLAVAVPMAVASIAWFSYLGATQTNRAKPWMRRLQQHYQSTDRFSQDEAAAARFGIYTVVIWICAIVVFLVVGFTVSFAWSWLALVAGLIVFFLVLARMLFPGDGAPSRSGSAHATTKNGADHD